ncbi:Serine/threonine-protein kinase PknB [Enhygromyxa salina]|uniref:Serine/threonine-protein kinase PknB n=2 Tax=Enhygromyxa salina TaxID=215803 RepID=A0A0C2DF36_9BACT|nr:Serine/threonine-protein kinase PknB [Enhygromyxa salina]
MAEVWMADRVRMGARKTVAIKLLNPASRDKQDYRRMFLAEAQMSMSLGHSSIVNVFDVNECDGECFIAMEWVDGLNLAQLNATLWERGEGLPLHVGVYIVTGVLRALDHAHNLQTPEGASIVHRDVSPQNVMLSVAGEVKLMDFGVARFSSEETAGVHVKGKLRYMPPEQLQGNSRDPTVDLFAVGALLYELIERRRFRNTDDDVEMLAMILGGQTPTLSHRERVPPPILQVLDGLLAPNARQRIGSARAALRMLTQWSGYQNAAIELEDYVVRYRDLCSTTDFIASDSRRAAAGPIRQGTGSSAVHSRRVSSNSSTSATFAQLGGDAVDSTGVSSLRRSSPRSRFNTIAAPAIAGFGLLVGCSSMMVAVHDATRPGETGDASNSEFWAELAAATHVENVENVELVAAKQDDIELEPPTVAAPEHHPEPQPQPEPEPDLELGPEPELEPDLQLEPEVEPEPEPEQVEDPPPDTPEPKQKEKVKVSFAAGNFRSLYIKVGGRQLTLQPFKTVHIPVGNHTIQIRQMSAKTWQRIGRAKFEAGKTYEVLMAPPGSFTVTELR